MKLLPASVIVVCDWGVADVLSIPVNRIIHCVVFDGSFNNNAFKTYPSTVMLCFFLWLTSIPLCSILYFVCPFTG